MRYLPLFYCFGRLSRCASAWPCIESFRRTSDQYWLLAIVLFMATFGDVSVAAEVDEQFFENKIRPLLVQHCQSCHGDKKQESDLRLDDRASILSGGSSGEPAAIPGKPADSLLLQYVRHDVEGMEMPPDKPKLSDREIGWLETWIEGGLVWPATDRPIVQTMDQRLEEHRVSHWAFQPPRVAEVPALPKQWRTWPQTKLDLYVLRRLLDNDMTPTPPADSRTFLRRVKFDLVGLPLTESELKRFEADSSPNRKWAAIDRLLTSPLHGEHWARHWMDVARYADTRGYSFQRDRNYPWAYTYRDYLIRSFNNDLPFDQFVVEQIAADLLPIPESSDNRSLAALGFLTVGRKFNNPHDDIDDKIDAVTRGFLGLTVACARCHDHKYDAIPTEDYYSLYGVFNSSQEASPSLIGEPEDLRKSKKYEAQLSAAQDKLNAFESNLKKALAKEAASRITEYLQAAFGNKDSSGLRKPIVDAWRSYFKNKSTETSPVLFLWAALKKEPDDRFASASKLLAGQIRAGEHARVNSLLKEAFIEQPPTSKLELATMYGEVLFKAYETWQSAGGDRGAQSRQPTEVRQLLLVFTDGNSPADVNRDRMMRYATKDEKQEESRLSREVRTIKEQKPEQFERAMVMQDKANPPSAYVFVRGQAGRRGAKVPRQVPLVLSQSRRPVQGGSGRKELAETIVSDRNPLTARVFVNRVWMHYFGRPLVETPSDFGIRSEPPLQQDVLDYLASEFMANNWSVKWLHREITGSAAYQQSSWDRVDSGRIASELFKRDPENRYLWRMNRKRLGFEATRDALLSVSGRLELTLYGPSDRMFRKLDASRRRTVYGYIDRQDLPNLLRVYDYASPDQSAAKRTKTTVPQQALFLLNSPWVRDLAESWAQEDVWNALSASETIELAYKRILQRTPTKTEQEVAARLFRDGIDLQESRTQLIHVLLLTNEFIYVD